MAYDDAITESLLAGQEPTAMIVDAHLHVWRSMPEYPDQTMTTMSPVADVPIELLRDYMREHEVSRAVLVQPVYPGEDNSYVAACAEAEPERFAAVCVVDPRRPDAADRLEHWVRDKGCRGLRLRPRMPAESGCFGQASTDPLWESAAGAGIAINVLGSFAHLDAVGRMAERHSSVITIIDHFAHPPELGIAAADPLLRLARYDNVMVKVSGFPYFSGERYPHADCVELVRAVYDRFGAGRMIWGSDFPHILLQSGYGAARHWVERMCPFLTAAQRDQVMGGNASRIYFS